MSRPSLVLFALILILPLTGCTRLIIDSQPDGATVLWSPDGLQDWRPWPPRAWASQSTGQSITPLRESGRYGDSVWITVEKEGYYRPLPRLVQLYPARKESVSFELEETPEALRRRMEAEGKVLFGDQWVDPQSVGLVAYEGVWLPEAEAFVHQQRAKGLVEYEGEWLTQEQYRDRFAADQRAKGLILFKNRWVSAEVQRQEEAIDAEVRILGAGPTALLPPPKIIGRIESETAQIQILNATGHPARFVISGPMSREYLLQPYDSQGMTGASRIALPPGRYIIAVIPRPVEDSSVLGESERQILPEPALSEQPLAPGFQYLFSFDGGRNLNLGDLEDYEFHEPELPYDLPTIDIPDIQIPERPANQQRGSRPGPPGEGGRAP